MSLIPQNPSITSVSGTTVTRGGNIPTIKVNSSGTADTSSSTSTSTSTSSNKESTDNYAFSTWAPGINPNQTAERQSQFTGSEWQRLAKDSQSGAIKAQGVQEAWKVLSAGLQSMIAGLGKLGQAMAQAKQQGGGGGGNGESGAPEQNQQRESSVANRDRGDTQLFGLA